LLITSPLNIVKYNKDKVITINNITQKKKKIIKLKPSPPRRAVRKIY
jgi:hypothetical protein